MTRRKYHLKNLLRLYALYCLTAGICDMPADLLLLVFVYSVKSFFFLLSFSLTCDVFIDFSMFIVETLASWFGLLNYIASTKCHCAS